jgi:Transposase DDE domain group 1
VSHPTPRRTTSSLVKIGNDDPTLTGHAGLLLTGELTRRLRVIETIDEAVNRVRRFKQRQRGLGAGELMLSLAETVMAGGDHLVHLDQLRGDLAGAELRAVTAPPAPTTAGQLLRRLGVGQCRAVVAAMAELGNRFDRELGLPAGAPVTLDMDGTLSEVYGRQKELANFNHEGRRGFLSQFVTWDERRRIMVADLLKGSASDKPGASSLLRRALRALPADHGPVSLRADSGFYAVELLETCRRHRVEFCVSVTRTQAMWSRLYSKVSGRSWRPALDMEGAEVAECAYTPTGWKHEPLRLLIRRVRIEGDEVSADVRSRRRRTIPKGQLALLEQARVGYVFSYSFVATDKSGDAIEIERWHRQRAHIEERVKEVKNGCGLVHLPLREAAANRAWQAAAVVAHNLVSMLAAEIAAGNRQRLRERVADAVEEDDIRHPAPERVQAHNLQLIRRCLINVPAKVVHRARQVFVRLAASMPWGDVFKRTYDRLLLLNGSP